MSFEQTSNYSNYLHYKQVKESLFYSYKGVDLSKSVAWNLLGLVTFKQKARIHGLLKQLFIKIDVKRFVETFEKDSIVFSTIYNTRKDHAELLRMICSSVSGAGSVQLNPHEIHLKIKLRTYYKMYHLVFKNILLKKYSLLDKLCLTSQLIYHCNLIDELEKEFSRFKDVNTKKYIPFLSAVGAEATITQFLRNKGLKTYHIFHGIFGRYKYKIANDIINGENITAEYILAFSEIMKEDLVNDFNHHQTKVFVAGNPKYPYKKIKVNMNFKTCIVLNGFKYYDQEFLKLLKLLDLVAFETGIKFYIKPHPNSNILSIKETSSLQNLYFVQKERTLKDLFYNRVYDFAITFNTVTYYECMYYDMICFRFGINDNIDFVGLDDKFTNKETFLDKIKKIKNLGAENVNTQIEQLLIDALGMGINNYQQIMSANLH